MSGEPPRAVRATPPILWGIAVALGVGLLLRCVSLGDRLPHHDEMLHLWFSEGLAFDGSYRASPAYHGPLLYHLEALVFWLAGSGLWQARLVPALAGLGAMGALVALAAREAGARAALAVAVLVALSPTWVYYTRFDSHDTLILLFTAAVAWGRWLWSNGRPDAATWLLVPALGLAWCTKLNALFVAAAIVGWPLARVALRSTLTQAAGPWAFRGRWPSRATVLLALGVTLVAMAALFVTTFIHESATGTPREALGATIGAAVVDPVAYWARLNQDQRLPGPFHYYAALLSLYEPLLVLGVALALATAWGRLGHPWRVAGLALVAGGAAAAATWRTPDWTTAVLHLHPQHLLMLPLLAVSLWALARDRLLQRDESGLWWTWMAAAQTGLYGYAGEKVPWLAVHVALPWMMIAGPAIARAWKQSDSVLRATGLAIAVTAATVVTGYGALAVVAWTGSDPAEPLIQLEYAADTHHVLGALGRGCPVLPPSDGPCVETTAAAAWPTQWYLRHAPGARVNVDAARASHTTPFIFVPARRATGDPGAVDFSTTHVASPVRFTTWGTWTEWLQRPSVGDLWRFWWRRESLGPRRGVAYELWVRADLESAWAAYVDDERPSAR